MFAIKILSFIFYFLTYVCGDCYTTYTAIKLPNLDEINPIVRLFLKNNFTFIFWIAVKLFIGLIYFNYIEYTIILGLIGSLLTINNYRILNQQNKKSELPCLK